jgi:hypothetical protein
MVLDLDKAHLLPLGVGALLTLAVGVILMGLLFHSSRSGHDDVAHQAQLDVNRLPQAGGRSTWHSRETRR